MSYQSQQAGYKHTTVYGGLPKPKCAIPELAHIDFFKAATVFAKAGDEDSTALMLAFMLKPASNENALANSTILQRCGLRMERHLTTSDAPIPIEFEVNGKRYDRQQYRAWYNRIFLGALAAKKAYTLEQTADFATALAIASHDRNAAHMAILTAFYVGFGGGEFGAELQNLVTGAFPTFSPARAFEEYNTACNQARILLRAFVTNLQTEGPTK